MCDYLLSGIIHNPVATDGFVRKTATLANTSPEQNHRNPNGFGAHCNRHRNQVERLKVLALAGSNGFCDWDCRIGQR